MNKNNRNLLLAALVFILFLGIAASAFFTYRSRPMTIGFSANLTGRNSEIGIAGRNGAELAIEEINTQGGIKGRKLKMKVVDDNYSEKQAKIVDSQLLSEGIFAIIGHLTSNTGLAVQDNYVSGKFLYLSPLVSTDTLSGKDDFFFRVISSNQKQGELIADYALNTDKISKFAIIYEDANSAYTEQLVNFSEALIVANGGTLTKKVSFRSDNTKDLKKTAADVLASNPQGVLIVASGIDVAVLSQNLKSVNPDIKLYTGPYATTPDLLTVGGKAVEGLVAVTIYSQEDFDGPLKSFTERYVNHFHKQPDFSAANAYISVKVMAKALMVTDSFTPSSLKEALLSITDYDGLKGEFGFDRFGDVSRSYCLIKVTDGHFRKVK